MLAAARKHDVEKSQKKNIVRILFIYIEIKLPTAVEIVAVASTSVAHVNPCSNFVLYPVLGPVKCWVSTVFGYALTLIAWH